MNPRIRLLRTIRARTVSVAACLALFGWSALHAGITPGSKDIGAVWFIGDSITQSNADGDSGGSPRKSLYDLLTANGYTFSYTGHHILNVDGLPTTGASAAANLYHYHSGISGSVIGSNSGSRIGMTQGLLGFWNSERLARVKPEVILIMLGTNDVDQGIDLANAPARLTTFIDEIYTMRRVGDPTILVASIPPNRTTVPGDVVNTAAFNAEVPQVVAFHIAQGRDVHFVDQFTPIEINYALNMRGDNLHPNATGNDTMAQQWFAKIQSIVNTPVEENFDMWAASFGIPQDENDDGDHDSLPALLEYGLGFDPTAPDTMPPLVAFGTSLQVTWPKGAQAAVDPEISYAVRVSTDLSVWLPPDPPDLVEVANSLSLTRDPADGGGYFRLEVIRNE